MCGIAGVVSWNRPLEESQATKVRGMCDALAHRGPDGERLWQAPSNKAILGFRRLAFLDLSESGMQPMHDNTGRYTLTFNGEIYNFRALRESLQNTGINFRSGSDTEVLLQLFIQQGVDALSKLRGMFGLAIWDEQEKTLTLARDRFGIKPVYFHETGGSIVYASEIQAIQKYLGTDLEANSAALLSYFQWGSVLPPFTWKQGIESLMPGQWRRYDAAGRSSTGFFADSRKLFVQNRHEPFDETAYRQCIGQTVQESVKLHLESDVPVGVFLSGGIDSSSIVAAMRSITNGEIRSYTITFEEEEFSEKAYAQKVADTFGTTHQTLTVTARNIAKDLPTILGFMDQPTLDGINSYYVSKGVVQAGIKAVLSGTGGDEMFCGYTSHRMLPKLHSLRHALKLLGPLASFRIEPRRKAKWKHLCHHSNNKTEIYRTIRGLFMPHELGDLLGPRFQDNHQPIQESVLAAEEALFAPVGEETSLASASRCELRQYLATQLLRDIDVMSMAHSLEVRVPLVDHEIQMNVWPALGSNPKLAQNKRLLYETLAKPLPQEAYNRKKQGFTMPFEKWVGTELREPIMEGMRHLAATDWISPKYPEHVMSAFTNKQVHWSKPWALGIAGLLMLKRVGS